MSRSSKKVRFMALLNDSTIRVSASPDDTIVELFQGLLANAAYSHLIPPHLTYPKCEFYRVIEPVLALKKNSDEEFVRNVRDTCRQESNREKITEPLNCDVSGLSESGKFHDRYVYLVIHIPDPIRDSKLAIEHLRNQYDKVFNRLVVEVHVPGEWTEADVTKNLIGGGSVSDGTPSFMDIFDALAMRRSFKADADWGRDLENARGSYTAEFDGAFVASTGGPCTVTSGREFVAFYNVLRCFNIDVGNIQANDSSALKASNFTVHFVQPPFFSEVDHSRAFEYYQEKSWKFPIFLRTTSSLGDYLRFTPRSDWMVISRNLKIPFIISEVISEPSQSDRNRMLVQATALARTGNYLTKSTSKRRFFVVAVYIDKRMVASRYLVRQPETENPMVYYHRQDFDLAQRSKQLDFLREMYNLYTLIAELAEELDGTKGGTLSEINTHAQKVVSLTAAVNAAKLRSFSKLGTIPEKKARGAGGAKDQPVFTTEDIQDLLRNLGYKFNGTLRDHPRVAGIESITGNQNGYLKFVTEETEIAVLKRLSEIDSPSNHTIPDVKFWPVRGGTVISMPVAGDWLNTLAFPDKHLWSAARQLFEAVGFMHENNIAHMDLKPQNILIPRDGGRLSLIDFSLSIQVDTPDEIYFGVVGTEGYIAPEVKDGEYKPMLADLWSVGKSLNALCSTCYGSPAGFNELFEIAKQLMDPNPEARPKMSDVLKWMSLKQREDEGVTSELQSPPVAPVAVEQTA